MFVIGVIGCLFVIPITAYRLFAVLFENGRGLRVTEGLRGRWESGLPGFHFFFHRSGFKFRNLLVKLGNDKVDEDRVGNVFQRFQDVGASLSQLAY